MMEFFWRRLRRGDRGFTLIELLIVVAIIAILAAILIPNFLRSRAQSQVAASKGNMKNIGTAMESYFVSVGYYPPNATGLLAGGYINALPRDPCTNVNYNVASTAGGYYMDTPQWTGTATACTTVPGPRGNLTGLYYTPSGGLSESP